MSERPTPETDAFAASEFVDKIDELTQLYDLSEKLERERDEAQFLLKQAQAALDAIHLEVGGWIKIMKENTD
jgi:hypothetical protein